MPRPRSARAELRELFGAPEVTDEQTDAEAIASRERLAELFGRKPQTHSSPEDLPDPWDDLADDEVESDDDRIAGDLSALFAAAALDLSDADDVAVLPAEDATGLVPAEDAAEVVVSADAAELLAPDDAAELLAPDEEADTIVRDDATAVLVPVGAAGAADHVATTDIFASVFPPTAPAPDAPATPAGAFFPAQRRGLFAWSKRVRWSVAASVVLLAAVVAGSVILAQTLAANTRAAESLAAAVAELESAEARATEPYALMEDAIAEYDAAVVSSRAVADSAGPPLAAVAGMTDEAALAAANAALAALIAQLDTTTLAAPPAAYARGDLDVTDIDAVTSAAQKADDRAQEITAATREARAAQAALLEKVDALKVAQVALGSSLPATADIIAGQNPRAEQSFREAVTAAARAVVDAQAAGGSGDAELLAYAAAVTALRADQVRAETNARTVTPPSNDNPDPEPEPEPVPEPVPEPPAPPAEPIPDPSPTEPIVP